jgi:hypothetical protein
MPRQAQACLGVDPHAWVCQGVPVTAPPPLSEASATRLAEYVRRRRDQLDLTAAEVYARGGPAPNVLSRIENGRARSLDRHTYPRLDHALGWEDGSARRTVEGGEPAIAAGRVATMEPAAGLISTTIELDGEPIIVITRAPLEPPVEAKLRREIRRRRHG